ncbi:ATPase [Gimesia sp.]|uniref:sacsin N-terminal ATP-binding-like domain-containing protein n=1 Tax=Gimesia sp. TaxID=2024833 RepID=UPI0032EE72C8
MMHESKSGSPPDYFYGIRDKARGRWEQLEADPELAAPWHQLFKQVQSPRHIVSELLQNADDAGATEADVKIVDGKFVFCHNGNDFTNDEFASLCRFGYSNKRSLHTIGFRGIGFKSIFSLGDEVQLRTPTLSVSFFRERFSEPVWINDDPTLDTQVSVTIKDQFRQKEIEKNLADWLASPASLLFFDSIRRLRVGDHEVRWDSAGDGPVQGSIWMTCSAEPDRKYLLIRSQNEPFPPEAVEEIRQERMISSDDDAAFPPCRVEIVLGMEGRLFVILPTGVKTELPFACNAPFIQDPARVKIKDPEISPTNRWLLKRAGELAAQSMLQWLSRSDLPASDRCQAYKLLSDVDREDSTIEGCCGTIVEEALGDVIEDREVLLTENETIVQSDHCVDVPSRLLSIWTVEQVSAFFDQTSRPLLSRHIAEDDRKKLMNWNLVKEIDKHHILNVLKNKHLPRPESWRQLLLLWAYVSYYVCKSNYNWKSWRSIRIVPVQSKDVLYSADEVVRLGKKRLLHSEDDWGFLSQYLLVINQNWPRYLAEQRRKADEEKDESLLSAWEKAQRVLEALDLDDSSDVSRVVAAVSEKAFANDKYPIEDCIRIAQIAAKLGATVTDQFQFVTQDELRTTVAKTILVDLDGQLDLFVDEQWYEWHVLNDDYSQYFVSCSQLEWEQWVASSKSKLLGFVPLENFVQKVYSRSKLKALLRQRGITTEPGYQYVTHDFIVEDWDFNESHWNGWEQSASQDSTYWSKLLLRILRNPDLYSGKATSAKVQQIATTGRRRSIIHEPVPSTWLTRFRDLPCLIDTRGQCHKPAELLRRTPDTEPLLDVELFVRAEDDNEHTRPLLKLLGVGDSPPGPDRLLDRLRALAGEDDVPVYELEKWYHRLDQLFQKCSTAESITVRDAFTSDSLILSQDGNWYSKAEVFLNSAEDDVPDVPLVHPSVRHLTLWQKIGVAERPTADLAIEWLKELPSGNKLSADELRRVRNLLPRFPLKIWEECGHWLSLDGIWVDVKSLKYSLTMQSLVAWRHLFQPVKQNTADLQRLDAEMCQQPPFSELPTLSSRIEDRCFEGLFDLEVPVAKPWMLSLGNGIARIELDEPEYQETVRRLGSRLASSLWQVTSGLESVPYIDGTPAGTARPIQVLWKDDRLYVDDRPLAQLFKAITQELSRMFDRGDIGDAIRACVERSPDFIQDYLEENFRLSPPDSDKTTEAEDAAYHASSGEQLTDSDLENYHNTVEDIDLESGVDDMGGAESEADDPSDDGDESVDGMMDDGTSDVADESNGEHSNFDEDKAQDTRQQKSSPPRKPPKPSLIELMAAEAGFSKEGTDRYFHPDGSWLQKANGSTFPWEHYSGDGRLVQNYWVKDCCIEREPLQLDAVVWNLCERQPNSFSIVLRGLNDKAVIYSGTELLRLRSQNQLTLHPANYRLVYQHEDVAGVEEGGQHG